MAEVSNKIIAGLLLLAIVISLFGIVTIMNIPLVVVYTGGATGTGTTNLSITGAASITMLRDLSDFGTGTPDPSTGTTIANDQINTRGFYNGSHGNGTDYGIGPPYAYMHVIENNGNTVCNLTIKSSKTAAQFIGGTNPSFKFRGFQNETNSCNGTLTTTYTEFSAADTDYNLCVESTSGSGFRYEDDSDTVQVSFKIFLPSDTPPGTKSVTITYTGTAI
jgi:hypothetical protein